MRFFTLDSAQQYLLKSTLHTGHSAPNLSHGSTLAELATGPMSMEQSMVLYLVVVQLCTQR
jgi:hypothetical protein